MFVTLDNSMNLRVHVKTLDLILIIFFVQAVMPEQVKFKMNGVIPSVPITTLAGIASLTDLLPEMPLPTPLPQTLTNKSLLFHPRVAEEAQILLSVRNENLVPQLILSLSQTSSDHIELKDNYANTEQPM